MFLVGRLLINKGPERPVRISQDADYCKRLVGLRQEHVTDSQNGV